MGERERFEREMLRLENAPLFSERTERLLRVGARVLPYASLLMCAVFIAISTLLMKLGIDIYGRMPHVALITWSVAVLLTCASLVFKKQAGY